MHQTSEGKCGIFFKVRYSFTKLKKNYSKIILYAWNLNRIILKIKRNENLNFFSFSKLHTEYAFFGSLFLKQYK